LNTDQQIDKDKHTRIVDNAERLLADAELLTDNGRYASACALAILALEEIGKVILRVWNVSESKGRGHDHLSKQQAVASLLLGEDLVRRVPAVNGRRSLVDLPKAWIESPHGDFVTQVDMAAVDAMKQLAFYEDDEWDKLGVNRKDFTEKDVERLLQKCRDAISIVRSNEASTAFSKAIFDLSFVIRAQRRRRRGP
jgi:AbiV family abortive infection protein